MVHTDELAAPEHHSDDTIAGWQPINQPELADDQLGRRCALQQRQSSVDPLTSTKHKHNQLQHPQQAWQESSAQWADSECENARSHPTDPVLTLSTLQ